MSSLCQLRGAVWWKCGRLGYMARAGSRNETNSFMLKQSRKQTAEGTPPDACEPLFELFVGATGPVLLGRLLEGRDAGRLVLLRPAQERIARKIAPLVDRVKHITHPKLLKVLGSVRVGDQPYVASEYISGASFVELRPKISRASGQDVAVTVRVIHDVLLAAHAGRRLLEAVYGYRMERSIYENTIWVADFGEAFLSELAVFEAMFSDGSEGISGVRGSYLARGDAPSADVRAAGLLLFEVLSRRAEEPGGRSELPSPKAKVLAEIVVKALAESGNETFEDPAAMAEALAELPGDWRASAEHVRTFLGRSLQGLEQRREKLRTLERASALSGHDDCVQSYRFAGVSGAHELETVRPAALASGAHPTAPFSTAPTEPAIPALKLAAAVGVPFATGAYEQALSQDVHADDAAATVWVTPLTEHPRAPLLDEDATTVFVASKKKPAEASSVIRDDDTTEFTLRAKTDRTLCAAAVAREATPVSARRTSSRLSLFLALVALSALLSWIVARSGWLLH